MNNTYVIKRLARQKLIDQIIEKTGGEKLPEYRQRLDRMSDDKLEKMSVGLDEIAAYGAEFRTANLTLVKKIQAGLAEAVETAAANMNDWRLERDRDRVITKDKNVFDDHQYDLLRQMYADARECELKGIPQTPYIAVMETLTAHRNQQQYQMWVRRRDQLIREGLIKAVDISPGRWNMLELTPQGREIAKRLFDEMLKRDGYTEEDFFTKDIL